MNPYFQFISDLSHWKAGGKDLQLGGFAPAKRPVIAPDAPRVLIFSPHPDDECIIGGLALRLFRESAMRAINVAVTLGSNKARQQERLHELQEACDYLGFELEPTTPDGLEKISPRGRGQDPVNWARAVGIIVEILRRHQPAAILMPHELDWNSTHIGTNQLVMDALRSLPADFACQVVETEFWGQMMSPNLMVELSATDVADMLTALSFHVGEVQRNPYHLSVPAWLMDNVRVGAELVGGQGGAAPDFDFATLYRVRQWQAGELRSTYDGGRILRASDEAAALLR